MATSKLLQLAEAMVGALRLGVPAGAVVEAIPFPDAPALLPRRRGALAGVVGHLGRMVPVVDLARWVELGAAPAGAQARTPARAQGHVLVLHEAGRTIGLKVDAVGALLEVAPEAVTRLHHDDDPDEVFHSVARAPDGGPALSLLDIGRLAGLAAAWCGDDADGPAAAEADGAADAGETRLYALLKAGGARLAAPAEALAEVIPMPRLERFGGGVGGAWCAWRGRHLPVLALDALLPAAGAEDAPVPALLAVLERDGLALGLPVEAALRLHAFDGGRSSASGGLTATVFDDRREAVRLLDVERLFARFPEAALSRRGDAGAGARQGAERRAANAGAYIVFDGDGLCAAAIDPIERILGPRDAGAALDGAGAMAWQDRAIPVRDLRAGVRSQDLPGQPPHLLVVRGAHGHVGYAVGRVHLLIPPGTAQLYRMGGAGKGLDFITAGDGAAQASYRIVDLAGG